jgi:hypothetical protein
MSNDITVTIFCGAWNGYDVTVLLQIFKETSNGSDALLQFFKGIGKNNVVTVSPPRSTVFKAYLIFKCLWNQANV